MYFRIKTRLEQSLADTLTPVSLYLRIRDHFPESILLEHAGCQTKNNHYSFICFGKMAAITVKNNGIQTLYPDGKRSSAFITHKEQVKESIAAFSASFQLLSENIPDNIRGLFGYINYDAAAYFEDIQLLSADHPERHIPDIYLALYKFVILFDHLKNEIGIVENYPDFEQPQGTAAIHALIRKPCLNQYPFHLTGRERTDLSDEQFLDIIKNGKAHCYEGDAFQIVLSRAFAQGYKGDDFNVFRALRSINPSPYMFYCDYGDYRLFGASPEAQLKMTNHKASIYPIAGTYRKGNSSEEDHELAVRLRQDEKENAEHAMLVDLARNDLSKHYKKVTVHKNKEIQHFSHVMHLVSEVEGTAPVKEHAHAIDILMDSFPAGTLSGAPKFRAMQLIDRYENKKRGFYGGSIGFIGFNGDVNHAIMIRSFLSKANTLHYQAGAGIVAGSVAEKELQEINHKLAALRKALTAAQNI